MHDNAYGYGHEWGRGMEEGFVMDMSRGGGGGGGGGKKTTTPNFYTC